MRLFANFTIPFGFTLFLLCRAASAEFLCDRDGIQHQGTAQIFSRYAATCHVLEGSHSPCEFRQIKDNHGRSLHVWQLHFSLDVPGENEQPAPDPPQSGEGPAAAAPRGGLQLPPEILADKYVSQARRLLREKDHHGARQAMEKALSLQQEHGLEPQPEDHFGYAKVWFALGEPERAIESLVRYLQLRGRDADRYEEALDLLNRAEAEKARDEAAAYSAAQSGLPEIQAGETVVFDGMEFVGIPPGEFLMGSTGSYAEPDEAPVTRVWISRGFFLGKYEVTQDQWKAVMGHNPSRFSGCGNCPVEKVSWNNVQAFIRKLNAQAKGGRYRLPTEAEWEYAARAGTTTDTYAGDFSVRLGYETPILNRIAWYAVDSKKQTKPVGQKVPNSFGLHDMLGNVWEWVSDWHSRYPGGAVTDPAGPRTGRGRVARGGGWSEYSKEYFRASYRRVFQPRHRGDELGFRLVRTE